MVQAERMGEQLAEKGLGSAAVFLTSDAPRAVQTADIGAKILGGACVIKSHALNVAGHHPEGVHGLEPLIETVCEESGVRLDIERGLVIVAHQPLLAAITGIDQYTYGLVSEYAWGSWTNTNYEPSIERLHLPHLAAGAVVLDSSQTDS